MSEFPRLHLAVAFTGVIVVAGVDAAMYKWTDESGQTVYSQTPPSSGSAIKLKKPPEPSPAEIERARETQRQEFERSHHKAKERAQARSEEAKHRHNQEIRAKNCETARNNLSTIENLGRHRVLTPDGEPASLSEEEREAKMSEARAIIKNNCD